MEFRCPEKLYGRSCAIGNCHELEISMKLRNLASRLAPVAGVLLFSSAACLAADFESEQEEISEKLNTVTVFMGGTHNDHDETGFSIGLGYEHLLTPNFGIGVFGEYTFKPIDTGILGIPFAFHPYDGWLLFVMPGVEFAGVHTEFLFRRGIGYEVELSGDHTFTPGLKVDFVNDEANFVFGAGFGTRFSAIRWFPRKYPLSVISGHSAGFV